MSFCSSPLRRSAYKELLVAGSRWTRLLAKSPGPAHVAALSALPRVTVIPVLHVASIEFYDAVLGYMEEAVQQYGSRVRILLEGICDDDEHEEQQRQEYRTIMASPELQATMKLKAAENSLFPPDVMRDMCTELALDYNTLQKHQSTIRLQECYLKPKMAATCGLHLFNDADLNMREVQAELADQALSEEAVGAAPSLPTSIPISEIGGQPRVKAAREKKVAAVARRYCARWVGEEVDGEVIIPWGFFHTEQIVRHICTPPKEEGRTTKTPTPDMKTGEAKVDPAAAAALSIASELTFVRESGFHRVFSFGVPEEVLRTPVATSKTDTS